jgi:hypothetical protein
VQTKTCTKCSEVLALDRFYRNSRAKSGYQSNCKRCQDKLTRAWGARNPDRVRETSTRAARKRWRQNRGLPAWGLTVSEYEELLAGQGGVCRICGKPPSVGRYRFHLDHDHESGVVRGLVCNRCNSGMGFFGDDPVMLRRAAAYLEGPPDPRLAHLTVPTELDKPLKVV